MLSVTSSQWIFLVVVFEILVEVVEFIVGVRVAIRREIVGCVAQRYR